MVPRRVIRRPALHRKHSDPVLVNSRFVHDLVRGDKLSRASVTSVFVEGLRSGLRWFNLAVGIGGWMCRTSLRARSPGSKGNPRCSARPDRSGQDAGAENARNCPGRGCQTSHHLASPTRSPTYGRRNPHPASSGGLYEFVDEAVAAGRDGAGERCWKGRTVAVMGGC